MSLSSFETTSFKWSDHHGVSVRACVCVVSEVRRKGFSPTHERIVLPPYFSIATALAPAQGALSF